MKHLYWLLPALSLAFSPAAYADECLPVAGAELKILESVPAAKFVTLTDPQAKTLLAAINADGENVAADQIAIGYADG